MYGKSIELFLVNGDADSIITAELSNWNGKAIKIPTIELAGCKREELSGAGVYFLFSHDDDNDKDTVYIGEAEILRDRLARHLQDVAAEKEASWHTVVAFTGRDLDKTLIRYLENRLVELARASKRYEVLTKNTYKNTVIKESQAAAMDEFVANIRILISALGYKVLEPLIKHTAKGSKAKQLYLNVGSIHAEGQVTSEGFVILKGATINEKTSEKSLSKGAIKLRNKIMNSDKVKDLTITDDLLFTSSSAAADFILGYSVSGPAYWKNIEGKSLKEIEQG